MISNRYNNKILRRVACGDRKSFEKLYHDWQPKLSSYIFSITREKDITAEVVQDVFLKIWMSRESLTEINNFSAFLFVVSRNMAINAFRKSMRELERFEPVSNATAQAEETTDESLLFALSVVDEAIDRLPERQKVVYLYHRHQKLTYQQIAEKLNIGKESVKTHLKLAVNSLKKELLNKVASALMLTFCFLNFF